MDRAESVVNSVDSVLLYYVYLDMDEKAVEEVKIQQLAWCKELSLMGRIRVTPEGINGTLDGSKNCLQEYCERMDLQYMPTVIDWKWASYPETCERRFKSVSVKIKDEVVGMVLDEKEREDMMKAPMGNHLSAVEWHEELKKDDENLLLLDVRNFYETRVGYFKYGSEEKNKAIDPMTRSFSDFKYFVENEIDSFKGKKVLMYCTGGVRCERASQFLRSKGIENVHQLHGGIHRYQEQYPYGFFKGKNFVYDPRVAVGPEQVEKRHHQQQQWSCDLSNIWSWLWGSAEKPADGYEVVGRCMLCKRPHDDYHSPYDRGAAAQTRCSYCRVLCLVCDECKRDETRLHEVKTLKCEMCLKRGTGVSGKEEDNR
jgi:predicted sulfurtransferase